MNRIEEIDAEIAQLSQEKSSIQEECTHPPLCLRYKYCSNTGNYDPHNDCYWTELRYTLCGKRWNEEGSVRVGKMAKQVKEPESV